MTRSTLVAVLSVGIAIGACAREAVRAAVSPAYAQQPAPKKVYMVRGGSGGREGGYERDLNALTEEGWHFVAVIPIRDQSHLIFERDDGKAP